MDTTGTEITKAVGPAENFSMKIGTKNMLDKFTVKNPLGQLEPNCFNFKAVFVGSLSLRSDLTFRLNTAERPSGSNDKICISLVHLHVELYKHTCIIGTFCFVVECRINTNTRTYSHPGGRPRGEGLAPPLRPTRPNPQPAALLRERVGALVHPVAFMRADVPEAHVDALASQARKGALVLVHQRAVAARGPRPCGGADREHRVGQDEHRRLRAVREHLVRPRERVVDGRELACVVGALGGSEELGRLFVGDDASRFFVERRTGRPSTWRVASRSASSVARGRGAWSSPRSGAELGTGSVRAVGSR